MPGASGEKGTTGLPGLPVSLEIFAFHVSQKVETFSLQAICLLRASME